MRNPRLQAWMLTIVLTTAALTAVSAQGQAQSGAAPQAQAQEEKTKEKAAAEIPSEATVLTIDGLCPSADAKSTQPAAGCKTVITRAEFEKLSGAVDPGMSPKQRRQFADSYARFQLLARAARKQGLDKDPRFQTMLELSQLQMLAQTYLQAIQEKSKQISPEEIDKFYRENPRLFEVADVLRIYLPANASEDSEKPVDMKAVAEQIRTRAVAGEDFTRLQKEASQAAHVASSPSVNVEKLSRGRLAPDLRVVFDLKPGEVSPVLPNGDSYFIYKLVSKQTPPLESIKEEVERTIQTQRIEEAMRNVMGSAKVSLNEEYFQQPQATKDEAER